MAKKNLDTEFAVTLKMGDRRKTIVVRSTKFLKPEQAKAHIEKLQKKGSISPGNIEKVEERARTNAKRPAVLDQAHAEGVEINNGGENTDAI